MYTYAYNSRRNKYTLSAKTKLCYDSKELKRLVLNTQPLIPLLQLLRIKVILKVFIYFFVFQENNYAIFETPVSHYIQSRAIF